MRIIHLADLHFQRDRYDEAAASIHTARDDGKAHGVDLFAIAGDTWDGPVQNTAGSRFADFLELIKGLADVAPVAMIYGTPSHDTDGSLEVFERIQAEHQIVILRPGKPYFLGGHPGDRSRPVLREHAISDRDSLLLFGVPEPNKKWLLANGGAIGKDEADEAARSAMRALLLGLGGMRREHAELPCVLLYHGQVSGAKTGTGYTADSGLAVSRDDLAAVGADYIALGDIHEPQQIPGLPAYYPGAIYPINWGETHKAGCNAVDLRPVDVEGGYAYGYTLSRLDFPHAQRLKIAHTYGQEWTGSVSGRRVWVETTCTREEAAGIDTDALLDKLLSAGALPGSQVTLNILPTETVRAGDIASKATLREKVQVWAGNSGIDASDSILAKADEIEREQSVVSGHANGAHIRYTRLRLRGAIGIWKKSRKDDIDLDLEALGAGVLAFASPNGAGKTTILENMHPWPCMLTRDGTLKDHFRLKDSCRDLYFTDDRTGYRYRALISIRADIASGAAEYFLYCDKGQGYEPLPGINGRKEPYEEAINGLFGSLELYLRTAFSSQRPSKYAPDLSEATKGQRKALFAELSGIDYLDAYKLAAKGKADALEESARELQALIAVTAGVDEEIKNIDARCVSLAQDARKAEESIKDTSARLEVLSRRRDGLRADIDAIEGKASRRAKITTEISVLLSQIKAIEQEVEGFRQAAEGRAAAELELSTFDTMTREAATLAAQKALVDEYNREALEADRKAREDIAARRSAAQLKLDGAIRVLQDLERKLARIEGQLSEPIQDACPTCGQSLPKAKRDELIARHTELSEIRTRLDIESAAATGKVSRAENELSSIVDLPPCSLQVFPAAARLKELHDALDWIDAPALRETIRKADEATVRSAAGHDKIAYLRNDLQSHQLEADALDIDLADRPALTAEFARAEQEYTSLRNEHQAATSALAAAKASVEAEGRARESALARSKQREYSMAQLTKVMPEVAEYRLLERACGADGIQALELDALAPGIAEIANRLLSSSGNTGRIEFRTTRIGGKGSKTKQIEDFLVYYIDDAGEEQEISTLSGGESVWIRKALYDAFAVIRARNTGIQFLTVFLDEADGALDPEARMRYLRMLETAHAEAGRYQTIIVTHSTELQAMVSQTINVADLGPRAMQEESAA